MSRPLPFAVGLAVAIMAALVLVEWPRIKIWRQPPHLELPAPEQVTQMRAVVWASGSRGQLETDVPWFDVPTSVARRIWRRFQPFEFVTRPPVDPDNPLGELVATTADGREIELRFYEAGSEDLVFTADGTHFYRAEPRNDLGTRLGGGLLLAGTLRHAAVGSGETANGFHQPVPGSLSIR
jgi:hypothetical protein